MKLSDPLSHKKITSPFKSTFNPLSTGFRGDVSGSFASMLNGAPTVAATGQPFIRDLTPGTGIVVATISSGALIAPDSGTASTAAYTGLRLPEDVKSYYCDVSFGDTNDGVGLHVSADVSLASILASALHIGFTASTWAIQYVSASVITTPNSGVFSAVSFGAKCRVGWRLSGNDIFLLLPNGQEIGPFTSAAAATRTNHCIIMEHFRSAAGAPGMKFYGIASVSLFNNPVAAGRANLLLAQNNLANAAWIKIMSGPTSGQPDSIGGTLGEQMMEVGGAANNQWFYQNIAKAAAPVRYSQRYKVKPIGRDYINLLALDGALAGQANGFYNLTTQTFGTRIGSFTDQFAMIYPLGNGWYQVQQEFMSNADPGLYTTCGNGSADTVAVYTGDITKGMVVYDQWLFSRPT